MAEEYKETLPEPTKSQKEETHELHLKKVVKQIIAESFSGPLPRPADLQEYEKVMSGAADRIFKMAESQSQHRQSLEKIVVSGNSKRAFCGLFVGAFVALCALGSSVFLIFNGHELAGSVIGGIDLVALVSVFVYGSVNRQQELNKKTQEMRKPEKLQDK
jgi:uncharacterized membrane protein